MNNLKNEIKKLIEDKFSLSFNLKDNDIINFELTGNYIGLDECDMVYLFAEIEKHYKITIPTEMLSSYQFNSILGICNIVELLLKKKDAN